MRSRCSAPGMVSARCSASAVSSTWYGLTISASRSSRAAPAKRLQDQDAALVVARRHELLAHQVHAVVQARDQADVGGAEQLVDGVVVVVRRQQVDRLRSRAGPKRALIRSRHPLNPFAGTSSVLLQRATRVGAATCTRLNRPTHSGRFSSSRSTACKRSRMPFV